MNHPCDVALPELLAPWLTRRSIGPKHLEAPGPDARELECLLRAAFTGPDHARLRPCRLEPLCPAQRERLATAFQNYRREADGDLSPEDASVERQRALRGPCLLAVTARIQQDHGLVPVHEQWIAVGAVIGNLLAAANALGYVGKMLSGDRVRATSVRGLLCDAGEMLVGFVYLGSARADAWERAATTAQTSTDRRQARVGSPSQFSCAPPDVAPGQRQRGKVHSTCCR